MNRINRVAGMINNQISSSEGPAVPAYNAGEENRVANVKVF